MWSWTRVLWNFLSWLQSSRDVLFIVFYRSMVCTVPYVFNKMVLILSQYRRLHICLIVPISQVRRQSTRIEVNSTRFSRPITRVGNLIDLVSSQFESLHRSLIEAWLCLICALCENFICWSCFLRLDVFWGIFYSYYHGYLVETLRFFISIVWWWLFHLLVCDYYWLKF